MKYLTQILICIFLLITSISKAQTYSTYYDGIVGNVSQANIQADLVTFENFGVKEVGTTQLNNAQAWITSRYQALGYTNIVEQPFSYGGNTTNNIIVTKTGSLYPNTYLVIDAHYDTINGTGTNDNGSGTVLILELARLLKDVNTEYSIKFIHFSGEEDGLYGSQYYVNNTVNPQNLDISLVFNIDEVGGVNGMTNDTIVCERDESNPPQNNAASDTATTILANCFNLYSNLNTEISFAYASDYVPFENNGEVITGLYEKNETPYAHTPNDFLVNMDVGYLFEVTKGSLGAALHFAVGTNSLSVSEVDSINNITVHPNPSHGLIRIDINSTSAINHELKVVDILGKTVYQTTYTELSNNLDLSFLNKGIYLLIFKNEDAILTKKLVLH